MANAATATRTAFDAIAAKYGITKEVVDHWLKRDDGGFAFESVEDFTYAMTQESDATLLLDGINGVNKIQQLSRVRQAWTGLKKEMAENELRKRKGSEALDLEELLPQTDLDDIGKQFHGRYKLVFLPELTGADQLVSTLRREITNRMLRHKDVWAVKSLYQQATVARKKQKIDKMTISFDEEAEEQEIPKNVMTYLALLFTLLISYARAGISKVDGAPPQEEMGDDSTLYVECPMDVIQQYYHRAMCRVMMMPPRMQLEWITYKDT